VPYHRSPARFLAPIALVVALFAVYTTVVSTSDETDDAPTMTQEATRTTKEPSKPRTRYTVKSGDVLSAIAADNDVSVDRILELNPELDPQSLRAGQRLKLRP
jgi:LysM repeat protein